MSAAIPHPLADTPRGLLGRLWTSAGLPPAALEHAQIGGEPILPSCFRVGHIAATCTAAAALAAAQVWRLRSGRMQQVSVNMAHAEIGFRSERYLKLENPLPDPFNPFWGYYRTADGRWLQIHTSFAHHLASAMEVLGLGPDTTPEAVRDAVSRRAGQELEDDMARRGAVASLMRGRDEWLTHPQGLAVSQAPLLTLSRIGEAPRARLSPGERPLQGLRVLDLTRVIAGPVCGRTLAEHGADVLRVQGPRVPSIPLLVADTGRGKRSTFLDLCDEGDRARFETLLAGAHVMVQGYRPGAIASRGYGARQAARLRPGIIYVSVCAYGTQGPWAPRRGFDSLVQMASGIAKAGATATGQDAPHPLPCQALDHCVGYLAAFAVMAALARRVTEGGSWHVRLSLVQVSEWLQRLGLVDGLGREEPGEDLVAAYMDSSDSPFGRTQYVTPVGRLSETPAYWARPATPLGSDEAAWLAESLPWC